MRGERANSEPMRGERDLQPFTQLQRTGAGGRRTDGYRNRQTVTDTDTQLQKQKNSYRNRQTVTETDSKQIFSKLDNK